MSEKNTCIIVAHLKRYLFDGESFYWNVKASLNCWDLFVGLSEQHIWWDWFTCFDICNIFCTTFLTCIFRIRGTDRIAQHSKEARGLSLHHCIGSTCAQVHQLEQVGPIYLSVLKTLIATLRQQRNLYFLLFIYTKLRVMMYWRYSCSFYLCLKMFWYRWYWQIQCKINIFIWNCFKCKWTFVALILFGHFRLLWSVLPRQMCS